MKATLTFNLPDDAYDYTTAINAPHYRSALEDLANLLRSKTKYAPDSQSDEISALYDDLREAFYQILSDNEVSLG